MKILLVSHTFLPKYVGGTEVYTYELAKSLISKGHSVEIFCADPLSKDNSYTIQKRDYDGITINELSKDITKYASYSQTYIDEKVDEAFSVFIEKYKPEVIHYLHLMHLSMNLPVISAKMKIPQCITLNDFWMQTQIFNRVKNDGKLYEIHSRKSDAIELSKELNAGPKVETPLNLSFFLKSESKFNYITDIFLKIFSRTKNRLFQDLELKKYLLMIDDRAKKTRIALKNIDVVFFPTLFLFQDMSKWGFQSKEVLYSQHGLNTSLFKKFKRKKSSHIRFAFMGAIIPAKGLDVLLKAWSITDTKDAELKIYGNFGLDKKYTRSLEPLLSGNSNVNKEGTFKPQEIANIFSEIDVLIVPSRWYENGPLVLRNALLSKTPVIATNLGSNPEFITHKKSGLLFKNENISDLSDQLSYVINNKSSLEKMSANIPNQKSIKNDVNNLIKYYRKLTKS